MKHLKYFLAETDLLESISDVNKKYTEEIYNIYFKEGYIQTLINLNNIRLPLKNIQISFIKSSKKHSIFIPTNSSLDNNILKNVILKFYMTIGMTSTEIKQEISHELVHVQEYYDKKISGRTESTHNTLNYALQIIREKNKIFGVFCDIIYNTTSDELNARINQVYYYLIDYEIIDKRKLMNIYKESYIYKKINEIKNLNFEHLCNGLVNRIGIKKMKDLINEFNKIYLNLISKNKIQNLHKFINNPINNIDDIKNYFRNWKIVIDKNIKKYERKVDEIITKVALDIHKPTFHSYDKICSDENLIYRIEEILKNNH